MCAQAPQLWSYMESTAPYNAFAPGEMSMYPECYVASQALKTIACVLAAALFSLMVSLAFVASSPSRHLPMTELQKHHCKLCRKERRKAERQKAKADRKLPRSRSPKRSGSLLSDVSVDASPAASRRVRNHS